MLAASIERLPRCGICGTDTFGLRYFDHPFLLNSDRLRKLLYCAVRVDNGHLLEGGGNILHIVLDAQHQLLCHL